MSEIVRPAQFPQEILVDPDKETRSMYLARDQRLSSQSRYTVAQTFGDTDRNYDRYRSAYLHRMADSIHRIPGNGMDVALMDAELDHKSRDIMVVMSPLNDGRPESTPGVMSKFLAKDSPSFIDVQKARPNSWSPLTKLDIDYWYSQREGIGMPRLQLFAPDANAFTPMERDAVAAGDMRPYGRLVLDALDYAEGVRHKTFGDHGDYHRVHFFAAGMAPKALGAAVHLIEQHTKYEIGSVVAMNLAMGEQSDTKLARDYSGRRTVGEAARLTLPENAVRIPEPLIRQEIDGHGAELAMRLRQARALKHFPVVRAIMRAERGVDYIEKLLEDGATVTVANARNEAMVAQTDRYLPLGETALNRIDIAGLEGKKVGMIANEHAGLVALVNAIGVHTHHERTTK